MFELVGLFESLALIEERLLLAYFTMGLSYSRPCPTELRGLVRWCQPRAMLNGIAHVVLIAIRRKNVQALV